MKWRDYEDKKHDTWEPLSHFLSGINQDLLDYVKKKDITLKLKDVTLKAVQENNETAQDVVTINTDAVQEMTFVEGLCERFADHVILNDPGEDSEPEQQ